MQNLFNYTTLSTRLEKTTRTLFVTLNRPDWNNAFKLEMLFELESLLAWCTTKVEINSIVINSSTQFFSSGYDYPSLSESSSQQLEKIHTKLQKIILAMMQLPQTILIDLGEGCETLASEFALGADIRIASETTHISFNHGHYGLVPAIGGMSLLTHLVGPSVARDWVLTGRLVDAKTAKETSFITHCYSSETKMELIETILYSIAQMAPVPRIQSKMGLFEVNRERIESGLTTDKKISRASMVAEDWKTRTKEKKTQDFMPAKSMSYAVKLSLIKSEDHHPLEQ